MIRLIPAYAVLFICVVAVCFHLMLDDISSAKAAPDGLLVQAQAIFRSLPDSMPGAEHDTPEKIALGKKLYFEPGMSLNKTQSCNTCHPVDNGRAGADNLPTSPGDKGTFGTRNSQTVLNAGFHIAQFWDGRAADLVEQAKGPILNPVEMAMQDEQQVVDRVKAIAEYREAFAAAFPGEEDPITYHNIAEAIAAFERTLISMGRFDDYLAGDSGALSEAEKEGLDTYLQEGCIQCHIGPMLGGMIYQKTGIYHPYDTKDLGRFDTTGKEADKYVFKVPTLRNATLTGPFFHDGRVGTVAEAVDKMGHLQLNRKMNAEQIRSIMLFVSTLADKDLTSIKPQAGGRPSAKADAEAGELQYAVHCLSCHGADGTGYKALADLAEVVPPIWGAGSASTKDSELAAFLKEGRAGDGEWPHPAFRPALAEDIAAYVNKRQKAGS